MAGFLGALLHSTHALRLLFMSLPIRWRFGRSGVRRGLSMTETPAKAGVSSAHRLP